MYSPLSGSFKEPRKNHKSKLILGIASVSVIPFVFSTFAANVTVGSGTLEFGQGSQQATACDKNISVALGEEWHGNPTAEDSSAGFLRVRTITVANLDLTACAGKKIRVRLINSASQEIPLGPVSQATALQLVLPSAVPAANVSDSTLLLSYLTSIGDPISGTLLANAVVSVSGTSVYDGSVLSATNGDVTFYIDSSSQYVNIPGDSVYRTTIETVNNASPQS